MFRPLSLLLICCRTKCYSHRPICIHKSKFSSNSGDMIVVKKLNKVMTIGINRPEVCNALNFKATTQLLEAVTELENDDNVSVGVIHGIAGNFCSGYDLKEIKNDPKSALDLRELRLTERWVSKPLVAAISGHAIGFGLDIALWCDLRVMEETAVIGCLQRRFGVALSAASIERLRSMVGLSRSMDWVLTGRSVYVEEAYTSGLVARSVACGTGLGQAYSVAVAVAKFPSASLLTDRAALHGRPPPVSMQEMQKEELDGADKFLQGCGRHGKNTGLFSIGPELELGMHQ